MLFKDKTLIIKLTFCWIGIAVMGASATAGVEVTVTPAAAYTYAVSSGSPFTGATTLTLLDTKFRAYLKAREGEKIGSFVVTPKTTDHEYETKPLECCYDLATSEDGISYKLDTAKPIKITYEGTAPIIYLPTLGAYSSVCTSAKNEWNSYRAIVRSHEVGHYKVLKNAFLKKSVIEPHFTSISWEFKSNCYKYRDAVDGLFEVFEFVTNNIVIGDEAAAAEYDILQDEYHLMAPFRHLDLSKECH